MIRKNLTSQTHVVSKQSLMSEQDEYLDMDLSHIAQYADLALEEEGHYLQLPNLPDEESILTAK